MDKVRELHGFYKVIVALGFTFLSLLILCALGLIVLYVIHLVKYRELLNPMHIKLTKTKM